VTFSSRPFTTITALVLGGILAASATSPILLAYAADGKSSDFNGDGKDDLAIGVNDESVGSIQGAGAVNVIYGSSSGLTATGDQLWTQDVSGVEGTAGVDDLFGSVLGTGDFDGNGSADLAIGTFHDDVGTIKDAGSVNVLYGSSSSGLSASNDQLWNQDVSGVEETAEPSDFFGFALSRVN
jgi:hypothetical protein